MNLTKQLRRTVARLTAGETSIRVCDPLSLNYVAVQRKRTLLGNVYNIYDVDASESLVPTGIHAGPVVASSFVLLPIFQEVSHRHHDFNLGEDSDSTRADDEACDQAYYESLRHPDPSQRPIASQDTLASLISKLTAWHPEAFNVDEEN